MVFVSLSHVPKINKDHVQIQNKNQPKARNNPKQIWKNKKKKDQIRKKNI